MTGPVTRSLAATAGGFLLLAALAAPAPATAASPTFTCEYRISSTWPAGFMADLTIHNNGPQIDQWRTHWTFDHATTDQHTWSAYAYQPTPYDFVASNAAWNGRIATGSMVMFSWVATAMATEVPDDITVNDTACPVVNSH
jgi:endo-1,4-beta-xylanase